MYNKSIYLLAIKILWQISSQYISMARHCVDTFVLDISILRVLHIYWIYYHQGIWTKLDNPLLFRLSRIKEREDFFIMEINGKVKMSKIKNKHITALDYANKTLPILPGESIGGSLWSFSTVIGTTVAIKSALLA